jgi:serine protease Do
MKRWPLVLCCLLLGGLAALLVTDRVLHGQASTPSALPKEMTSYRDLAKKILPAVVSIEPRTVAVSKKPPAQPKRRSPWNDQQIPEEFRKFFEEFDSRRFEMPDEAPHGGFGSGFLVDPKGVILTNYHVVAGAEQVEVQLHDGRKFTSRDIKGDRKTDLAIIRIQADGDLPYLEMGDSEQMEIGDRVLAAGSPFGMRGSLTTGIVSAKGRDRLGMNMYEDFIQTDAAINPGNSGGPLVSLEGKVIGINSAIRSRTGGFQGVGLAIPSNMAKNIMSQLLKDGVVRRGYLGVSVRDVTGELASRIGLQQESGVYVSQVTEGTPADKAGVKPGDVITSLAGKSVRNFRELQGIVTNLPVGQQVPLTLQRDGQPHTVQVTVAEQPENLDLAGRALRRQPSDRQDADALTLDKIGLEVTDLTPELAERYGLAEDARGALVTQVQPNSPASLAGLRRGMVLLKVDKKSVASANAAKEALEKALLDKGVVLQILTPQGGTEYVLLRIEEPVRK